MKVAWLHDHPDEPVTLFIECDDENRETRKMEIYRDGRFTRAYRHVAIGGSMLSFEPIPSLAEINLQPEFQAKEISELEFNHAWQSSDVTLMMTHTPS
jgi:hypothetical protein